MKKEIELKYKVNKIPSSYDECIFIYQYYFDPKKHTDFLQKIFQGVNINLISEGRIRGVVKNNEIENVKFFLTLKSKGQFVREEYEKEIDLKISNFLLEKNTIGRLQKTRYFIKKEGFTFEFDEFLNKSLYLVEIELEEEPSKQVMDKIESILTHIFNLKYENVTNDESYKNINIAKNKQEELER